jgi:ribose 5-phosphate isomerase B
MKIAFAADDENETTRAVVAYLSQGHSVLQVATATDWPSIGEAVGQAVSTGDVAVEVVAAFLDTTEADPQEAANIASIAVIETRSVTSP